MRWAQRPGWVFQIDVETCPNCGGTVKIIACTEDPPVIERILCHWGTKDLPGLWPASQAPPIQRPDLYDGVPAHAGIALALCSASTGIPRMSSEHNRDGRSPPYHPS